ncbi:MAG: PrgI family protein, partial [Patescibacteria group bacterium]
EEPLTTKQHAVPQQVFGVQFKLVGDLTIRQFAILAICGFFAFLFFSSNLFIIFRILISGTFLLAGVGFAFVPVQDQPLDQWIAAFFRAVYAPTRRMWAKSTAPAEFLVLEMPKFTRVTGPEVSPEESRRRLETYLGAIHEKRELNPIDLAEEQYLESIRGLAQTMVVPALAPIAAPVPSAPSPALTLEEVMAPPPTVSPVAPSAVEGPPPPPLAPRLKFVEATRMVERATLASAVNFTEPVYKVQRGRVASYFAARRNIRPNRRLTPLAIAGEMVYAPVREQIIDPELPSAPTLAEPTPVAGYQSPVPSFQSPVPLAPEPIAPPPPLPEPIPAPPPPKPVAPPPTVPPVVPSEVEGPPPAPVPEPEKPVEAPPPV